MRKLFLALPLALVVALAGRADAAIVGNTEFNNTPATAQNVDAFFSLDFSPDIGDVTGFNTSLFIPHVTVDALGPHALSAPEFDWFEFTVPFAGALGIFDIDYGMDCTGCGPGSGDYFDANLELQDGAGFVLAANDDFATSAGAGGSIHGFDSFIQHVFAAPGLYRIGVGQCCFMTPMMGFTTDNSDYALQISIEAHALGAQIPEPGTLALLGTGLIFAARQVRRRRRSAAPTASRI